MDGLFYQVIRVFMKDGKITNNVMDFETLKDARKRFYSVLAADIADDAITYHAAYIINSNGGVEDWKVYDSRPAVEPEEVDGE